MPVPTLSVHCFRRLLCLLLASCVLVQLHAFDAGILKQVGYHPGGVAYYDTPYFANALAQGGAWLTYTTDFGTEVDLNDPQFNADGYPKFLKSGERLRALLYGLHCDYEARPAGWPIRHNFAQGQVVLTWKGEADIQLAGGTLVSGSANGSVVNGRRVYRFTGNAQLQWLEVHAINAANPITEIRVWLPDSADPQNRSLEGQLFHPSLVARVAEADWSFIRFMGWQEINGNPERDWSDRRRPSHSFMTGILNHRNPAPGTGHAGDRSTGVALENLVALCNASGRNLWLCVPHLASEDYLKRMAQLVRFGSDGENPYTNTVANPVYPPLRSDLKVFLEYSNEIWSSGGSFPQGDWAQVQADGLGISKAQFNARGFCRVWSRFQDVFGGADRLVRVAAIFTALDNYSRAFLDEIRTHGATLNPPVQADVMAVTTYFGNGIQDWVSDQGWVKGKLFNDGYWTSPAFTNHLTLAHDEWMRRMLSGSSAQGGGFDATSFGGGFSQVTVELARTNGLPIIAYEGGPSLYTDYLDRAGDEDDGITIFIEAMNRHPRMREVYRTHLNLAKQKGLRTHSMFVDSGFWSKYGQWGHLEYPDQKAADSPKYQFVLDWMQEAQTLRPVDAPFAAVPAFQTGAELPVAEVGKPYSTEISTSGGNGVRTVQIVGQYLAPGLTAALSEVDPTKVRISGTATAGVTSHLLMRVTDADGDPAWRLFFIKTVGGPGTLVEFDFHGTTPIQRLPWTNTFVRLAGLEVGGWSKGTGIFTGPGDDALVYGQNQPANEVDSTLGAAITSQQYLSLSLRPAAGRLFDLRGKQVSFGIRRIGFHSARRYALFTSVGGFVAGNEVFNTTNRIEETDEQLFTFTLPDTAAYTGLTNALEFRIYGYSGQFGNEHKTSLTAFKLYGSVAAPSAFETWRQGHFTLEELALSEISGPDADPDHDRLPNFLEYSFHRLPKVTDLDAFPQAGMTNVNGTNYLSMTVTALAALDGPSFIVESSLDQKVWAPNVVAVGSALGEGFIRTTFRSKEPMNAHPQGYLRLRVVSNIAE